jgi:predicted ATPase/DNA-binding SARP family transcriptional activator
VALESGWRIAAYGGSVEFGVLGPLLVRDADGRAVVLSAAKVRTLLALLLVHRGETLGTHVIVDALWGENPPASAVNLVHGYVRDLRRALGADVVQTRPGGYVLDPAAGRLDAQRFADLVGSGRHHEALTLWRGPALAEWADTSWARATAARLEEERLAALEQRITADLDAGQGPALVAELTQLVTADPLRERLRALLIRALYQAGRQADALSAYRESRRVLAEEVGVDPGPELVAAQAAVLAHDPALAPRSAKRWGVPVQPTPLLGRERELEELAWLLGRSRLVTLLGPGGVGKTRLAIAAASGADNDLAISGDVWFAELVAARTPADVLTVVAAVLRLVTTPGPDPAPVVEFLRHRAGLLVLDNCEQVADEVATLVAALLNGCPDLRVLTTSRLALRLPGEQLLSVAGLSPEPAARLFEARARSVNPTVLLPPGVVRRVVDRVERLPLAVELAGARALSLTVEQIESGLAAPLNLLNAESRDADARHRTMRAVVGWSHDLLSTEDRLTLHRLSVFAGRFTVEAARRVTADDTPAHIERLLSRCLLVREDDAAGEATYRMPEVVREYAAERADSDTLDRARALHLAHHADFAADIAAGLHSARSPHWAALARAQSDDLRAAVRRAANASWPKLPRLVADLHWPWFLDGRLAEYRSWNELARSVEADPWTTARLDRALASTAMALGDVVTAEQAARRALEAASRVGDDNLVAMASCLLGMAAWARGDPDSVPLGKQAVTYARRASDPWVQSLSFSVAGRSAHASGDHRRGSELLGEGLLIAERLGEPMVLGSVLDYRAHASAAAGSLATAAEEAASALDAYRRIGYQEGIASAITLSGALAVLTDRADDARALLDEAAEICERMAHAGGLATIPFN